MLDAPADYFVELVAKGDDELLHSANFETARVNTVFVGAVEGAREAEWTGGERHYPAA